MKVYWHTSSKLLPAKAGSRWGPARMCKGGWRGHERLPGGTQGGLAGQIKNQMHALNTTGSISCKNCRPYHRNVGFHWCSSTPRGVLGQKKGSFGIFDGLRFVLVGKNKHLKAIIVFYEHNWKFFMQKWQGLSLKFGFPLVF